MAIAYDHVHSSNIRALGYANGVGYVEFNGGARWGYTMERGTFEEMKAAKSIGGYFSKNIKGKTPVAFRGHCCSNSPCKRDATKAVTGRQPGFVLCDECAKEPRFGQLVFIPYDLVAK